MTPEEYIEARLDDQIDWYSIKSRRAQNRFKILRGLEICAASVIPVLALASPGSEKISIVVAILGALIAAIAAFLGLLRYQEQWTEYRTTSESLKHEKFLYLTKTTPYDTDDRYQNLVQRVESLISQQNSEWTRQGRQSAKSDNAEDTET